MAGALQVEHLWKTFQIPHERRTTLFENLASLMRPNTYETFTVLKDVNFEVEKGECIGIIGDNGSGKSTLLKIIANILRPTKGTVSVKGKLTPFLELGVGFQPELTVRENVGVYATVMGLSRKEIKGSTDEVIEFAGLRKFEDTKLKNLSSGMQVRLAFSTAIQTDPDVLLVDEVLAVGDMEFQQKCFDVFNKYRKEGVTILFVSHDLGAVRRFCDRTLLLGESEQRAFGETENILDEYVYGAKEDAESPKGQSAERADPEQEKSQTITRWGDSTVEIAKVQLLDKFGHEGWRFNSFDPMRIRIHYRAHSKVLDPVFGIALYAEDGHHLYGTNTELKDIIIDHIEKEGYIDLEIERITMLSGKFLLTVAVHAHDGKPYDWIDKQYSFDVVPSGRDAGIFEIPCRWMA
jgi:lipopolysaccharide transport system ATP-binding protein